MQVMLICAFLSPCSFLPLCLHRCWFLDKCKNHRLWGFILVTQIPEHSYLHWRPWLQLLSMCLLVNYIHYGFYFMRFENLVTDKQRYIFLLQYHLLMNMASVVFIAMFWSVLAWRMINTYWMRNEGWLQSLFLVPVTVLSIMCHHNHFTSKHALLFHSYGVLNVHITVC
jgi:hypothetical protein